MVNFWVIIMIVMIELVKLSCIIIINVFVINNLFVSGFKNFFILVINCYLWVR